MLKVSITVSEGLVIQLLKVSPTGGGVVTQILKVISTVGEGVGVSRQF